MKCLFFVGMAILHPPHEGDDQKISTSQNSVKKCLEKGK